MRPVELECAALGRSPGRALQPTNSNRAGLFQGAPQTAGHGAGALRPWSGQSGALGRVSSGDRRPPIGARPRPSCPGKGEGPQR